MTTPSLKLRVLDAARSHRVPKRPDLVSERFSVPAAMLLLAAGAMSLVLWVAGGPTHAAGRPLEVSVWVVSTGRILAGM